MDTDSSVSQESRRRQSALKNHNAGNSNHEASKAFATAAKQYNLDAHLHRLRDSVQLLEQGLDPERWEGLLDDFDETIRPDLYGQSDDFRSIPDVNLMTMEDYRRRHDSESFSLKHKHYSIDVVMAYGWARPSRSTTTSLLNGTKTTEPTGASKLNTTNAIRGADAVRFIQINSAALCAVLHEVGRYQEESWKTDAPSAPLVLLAPFKPICLHIEKLEDYAQHLRERCGLWEEQAIAAVSPGDKDSSSVFERPQPPQRTRTNELGKTSDRYLELADELANKVPVFFEGQRGVLFFNAKKTYLHWAQSEGSDVWSSTAFRLNDVHAVERTRSSSPMIALHLKFDNVTSEFIFIHPELAHQHLESLTEALTGLIRRAKILDADEPSGVLRDIIHESTSNDDTPHDSGGETVGQCWDGVLPDHVSQDAREQDRLGQTFARRDLATMLSMKSHWKPITISGSDAVGARSPLSAEDRTSKGAKALEDLECLLRFHRDYLQSPSLALQRPFKNSLHDTVTRSVRYGELCSFLQIGQEVVINEFYHKFWRISRLTGGRPVLDHLLSDKFNDAVDANYVTGELKDRQKDATTESGPSDFKRQTKSASESAKWVPLVITCYYLDFDGRSLAPMERHLIIPYFSGLREITALSAIPVDWIKQAGPDTLNRLIDHAMQGGHCFRSKCLDTNANGTRLFYYDGVTNTRSPSGKQLARDSTSNSNQTGGPPAARYLRAEDISSHVVIDFDKAFQYHPDWKPIFEAPRYDETTTAFEGAQATTLDYASFLFVEEHCQWELGCEEDLNHHWEGRDRWKQFQRETFVGRDLDARDFLPKEATHYMRKTGVNGYPSLSDRDLLLLPGQAFGFVLQSRKWASLDVWPEVLQDVDADSRPWEGLQIPTRHKEVLDAQVKRHFKSKEASDRPLEKLQFDIIQGKGDWSSYFMETSTAECIASKYCKPLLPITCGNLGIDAYSVELALTESFELAQAWDCIVLLDEADVFLAQREQSDLARNALVSLFLRTLEYYSGILFLTTNRIGSFDEAFRSRIHLPLFYSDLDREFTARIWETQLERICDHDRSRLRDFNVDDQGSIIQYARVVWDVHNAWKRAPYNGRQIRNAFQTAVALAQYEAHEGDRSQALLSWKDFRRVMLMSHDFEKYLVDTRDETDSNWMTRKKLRRNTAMDEQKSGVPGFGGSFFEGRSEWERQEADAFKRALEEATPWSLISPLNSHVHPMLSRFDIVGRAPNHNDNLSFNHPPQQSSTFGPSDFSLNSGASNTASPEGMGTQGGFHSPPHLDHGFVAASQLDPRHSTPNFPYSQASSHQNMYPGESGVSLHPAASNQAVGVSHSGISVPPSQSRDHFAHPTGFLSPQTHIHSPVYDQYTQVSPKLMPVQGSQMADSQAYIADRTRMN